MKVEKYLKQFAVWWKKIGDDPSGNPLYGDAVEVKCRWEDVHEVFSDENGDDQVSNAIVIVDRDMKPVDVIWLGKLEDVTSQSHPEQNDGAYRIRKFEKIPDKKAKNFLRQAIL